MLVCKYFRQHRLHSSNADDGRGERGESLPLKREQLFPGGLIETAVIMDEAYHRQSNRICRKKPSAQMVELDG